MIHIHEEAMHCLLCKDAPCTKVCKKGDPARAIRAIRFNNEKIAWQWVKDCSESDLEAAERACIHYDRPIRIKKISHEVGKSNTDSSLITHHSSLPDLSIDFCGIKCENPFFLASSAICTNYEMVARAFEIGWAGVFFKTICMQDINEVSPRFDAVHRSGGHGDFFGFRNMEQLSENPVEVDFDILKRLKQNYPTKVVIASIMGQTEKDWVQLAKMAEAAGCDAVELNYSCPQMRQTGMGSDVGQDPELVTFFTAYVKRSVNIPVIPKMTPNIAHISEPAMGAYFAGADAISAINTIKSVTLGEGSDVNGCQTGSGYSGKAVKPIALRHILAMAKNPIMKNVQYSGIGGIETWRDALEFIQLGCRNVQVCTSVMQYGYRIIDDLILGLQHYMVERNIKQVADLVGELLPKFLLPSDLVSCSDGGHQALEFDGVSRMPRLVGSKCVGCHLCRLVCPTGAIGCSKRIKKKQQ